MPVPRVTSTKSASMPRAAPSRCSATAAASARRWRATTRVAALRGPTAPRRGRPPTCEGRFGEEHDRAVEREHAGHAHADGERGQVPAPLRRSRGRRSPRRWCRLRRPPARPLAWSGSPCVRWPGPGCRRRGGPPRSSCRRRRPRTDGGGSHQGLCPGLQLAATRCAGSSGRPAASRSPGSGRRSSTSSLVGDQRAAPVGRLRTGTSRPAWEVMSPSKTMPHESSVRGVAVVVAQGVGGRATEGGGSERRDERPSLAIAVVVTTTDS